MIAIMSAMWIIVKLLAIFFAFVITLTAISSAILVLLYLGVILALKGLDHHREKL